MAFYSNIHTQGMDPASSLGVNVTKDSQEELVIVQWTTPRAYVLETKGVVTCAQARGTVCVVCASAMIME